MSTAAPVALSMLAHMVYQVVDLYFLAKIDVASVAGVNAAGSFFFVVLALMQVLNVGTIALIANAIGRRDGRDATVVFNQALLLSIVCAAAMAASGYVSVDAYLRSLTSDSAARIAGSSFMRWVLPGYALLLPMGTLSCTLRAAGIVQSPVVAYTMTVLVNAALAPILINGWGTGLALGARGAGLATTLSVVIGFIFLACRFRRAQSIVAIQPQLTRPHLPEWYRTLRIGLPASAESVIMFLSNTVVYYAIQNLGPAGQAGYGIGSRVLQVLLVPAMAIASAISPIAAQNLGARQFDRVRDVLYKASCTGIALMLAIALAVQWAAMPLAEVIGKDAAAAAIAAQFLRWISLSLVLQCFVYIFTGMFQGLGTTLPSLVAGSARFLVFVGAALWLSPRHGFHIEQLWQAWIASVLVQAIFSAYLLRLKLSRRLAPEAGRLRKHETAPLAG